MKRGGMTGFGAKWTDAENEDGNRSIIRKTKCARNLLNMQHGNYPKYPDEAIAL